MENKEKSCVIPDCQNTPPHKPLYPFLIDTDDINSWLLGVGSPGLLINIPKDNKRVCEQYFICSDHMKYLDSIKDVEELGESEEKPEEDTKDDEDEESGPDCLSQQLSTLSVSQRRDEDPEEDDEDSILGILEEESADFIELKNLCTENLETIFSLIPEVTGNVCRICGERTDDAIKIFSEQKEESEISLLEKIHYYLPIKLEEDDVLPKVICQECNEVLEKFHGHAMKSLATEFFFTNSVLDEELKKKTDDVLEALGIIPGNPEDLIICGQADDGGKGSQETVIDGVVIPCSQSSLMTSDEDERPYTKLGGLKQLRSYGKKRPMSQEIEDQSAAKRKREEPVFEKWFKCNRCAASSTDEEIIKFHKNRHYLNKPVLFWCNFCATEFPKESTFTNHVLLSHEEDSRSLTQAHKCSKCHRVYSLKSTVLAHYLVKCAVHPIQEFGTKKIAEEVYIKYAYVCEYCWEAFAYVSSLNQHRNKEHPRETPWNGQVYIDEKDKRERMMDIFGIKTAFVCKFCSHIFISLENYIYHAKEHADGVYKCTTCEKLFISFEEFKEHRETKHDYRIVFKEVTREDLTSRVSSGGEGEKKEVGEGSCGRFKTMMEGLYKLGVFTSPWETIDS